MAAEHGYGCNREKKRSQVLGEEKPVRSISGIGYFLCPVGPEDSFLRCPRLCPGNQIVAHHREPDADDVKRKLKHQDEDAKKASVAQKLFRLSLSSAALWPFTVSMLVAALVLSPNIATVLSSRLTMFSWQLCVSRHVWK